MHRTGTFGTYRWLLAILVANSHLGFFHHVGGAYAVFGFFTLSGYLMTLVLKEQYGLGLKATKAFYINRVLRIYPVFWVGIAVAWVFLSTAPHTVYTDEMMLPDTLEKWLANIAIFGMVAPGGELVDRRLISATWSLCPELLFYLALPILLLSRYLYAAWLLFAAYHLLDCMFGGHDFRYIYFSMYGWMAPFAIGTLIYFLRKRLPPMPHWLGLPLIMALCAYSMFPYAMSSDPGGKGFHIALFLNAATVYYLSFQVADHGRWSRLDKLLGDITYAFFIMHLVVGGIIRNIFYETLPLHTPLFFVICLVCTNLLAYVMYRYIEQSVNRFRARFKLS